MKRGIIFISALFLINTCLVAQQHDIDSLYSVLKKANNDTSRVNTLNILGRKLFLKNKFKQADSIYKDALKLAEGLGFKKGIGEAYRNIGVIYGARANYPEALKTEQKALEVYTEIGNKRGISGTYSNMGLIYQRQGNYPEAMKAQLEAVKLDEELGDKHLSTPAYLNLGIVFFAERNYPEALKNYLKALKLSEITGEKPLQGNIYINLGIVNEKQGNYPEALKYLSKGLKLNEETGNKSGAGSALTNIGNIYLAEDNDSGALNAYEQAVKIYKEIGDRHGMGIILGNIGNLYESEKDYKGALLNLQEGLSINKEIGNKEAVGDEYLDLATLYFHIKQYSLTKAYLDSALNTQQGINNKTGLSDAHSLYAKHDSATDNFRGAYMHYKLYQRYLDSIENEDNTKKLVSEQMQYEFDKKQDAEKAEQDRKDLVVASDKKKQRVIIGFVSGSLVIVLISLGLVFSRFRITKKQNKIIERQKVLVEEKNKDILDSINYAKRLQDAILPPLTTVKKHLPESFVLYKPKDIVAGDFYWMEWSPLPAGEGQGEVILVAACDCTGHGVPGALVSVVCSNALNRALNEFKIRDTGKLLDKTRELVLETFAKSEGEIKDGMDISLCAINTKTNRVEWSGANNPLWYIQNNELKEIKPDKQPVGKHDLAKPFSVHYLDLKKGDSLYLFTDGYADQFGGEKGKKFKYKQLQEKLLTVCSMEMDKQKDMLNQTIEEWKGDLEQVDDILIMGIRV